LRARTRYVYLTLPNHTYSEIRLAELRERFEIVEKEMASLTVGTDQIRDAINNMKYVPRRSMRYEHISLMTKLLDDSDASLRRPNSR
jgi:hypothetical protein